MGGVDCSAFSYAAGWVVVRRMMVEGSWNWDGRMMMMDGKKGDDWHGHN